MEHQLISADTGRPFFDDQGVMNDLAQAIENKSDPDAVSIVTEGVIEDPSVKPPLSTLRHLVIHWMERGQWRKALACANRLLLRTSLLLDPADSDSRFAGDFRFNAAKVHFNLGHYLRALDFATQAHEVALRREDIPLILQALRLRQEVLRELGWHEFAVASEREIRASARRYGVHPGDIPEKSAETSEGIYDVTEEDVADESEKEPITVRFHQAAL